ncbi:hypothetical protein [Acuticoccus sp.]|uniref:hypothetical protein n=1 Tax=Acuticoccus sp. TaxID=1904378 RepID=UPI003B52A3E2
MDGAPAGPSPRTEAAPGCLAPSALADADDDLSVLGEVCAEETRFTENGVDWRVQTFRSGRAGPLFVMPHDDEDAALATGAAALATYGGTLTAVESGGRRFNGGVDPNRNFHAGALACGGARSTAFVAAMVPRGSPVVALHTNAPGSARTGGTGSISIRAPYDGATAFPAEGPLAKEDAMVILASRRGPDDGRVRGLVERLNAAGVNVLVETVDTARTDCSLSHYAVANGLDYANVEAADGDAATQRAILAVLMPLL